ncbi:hypothetical protein [Arthrobacter sp. Soil763]|uniref:hypothetical protein n=1 Tax=Arthrobacter sp. Soil763 TaxID=1736402 RepID=UPI000AFFD569|nr:hypothetical protein [Arthrobacter sp. Soil763]
MSQPPPDPRTAAGAAPGPDAAAPGAAVPGEGRHRPDKVLLGIVAAIGVLVVVALAVVFLRGEAPELDPGSPAGVVQRYSKAVIEGDAAAAGAYLSADARSRCDNYYGKAQASSVVLISTTERGETATVRVSIVRGTGEGPFGPAEYAEEAAIGLVKSGGTWLINDLPYSLQTCTSLVPKK